MTRKLTDTTTTSTLYSTNGTSRTWTYTWSNFLLASVLGPRTDVPQLARFAYDSTGALSGLTNGLNQTTQITQHMPGGLPQTIVDPNGVSTKLVYDARLRLISSTLATSAGPLATTYAYDPAGNLLSVALPDGSKLTNTYDAAHRLTRVADLLGQSIAYTLDAMGNRTKTQVLDTKAASQRLHSAGFDAVGRMVQDIGGAGQTSALAYDSNGNLVTLTDPLKRLTQRAFDPLNRLVTITDPASGVTTLAYDPHDRPTSVIDPNGNTTSYTYDGFGDLIQQVSPVSGATVYRYDLAGNLTQKTDANGAISNYTYDALNRVLTTAYPGDPSENVTLTYDQAQHGFGVGRLTSVTDAVGTLSRSYDERGNILAESRVHGTTTLLTCYGYDAASRISSITYPLGWNAQYTRDSMGRVTAVMSRGPVPAAPVPVVSNIGYKPFGPITSLTFGNGVTETKSYDPDYRLTTLLSAGQNAIQNLTYGYDAADNVLSLADGVTPGNSQTFGYDVMDRLTNAAGGYGNLGYTYDKLGNRLTETIGGPTPTTLDGLATSLNTLSYNQAGRLAAVNSATQPIAQYTYDAFGQRIIKTLPGVPPTTLFSYDLRGALLEESNSQGNPAAADYIYLDDGRPIATLTPGAGNLYFLHDDRLGTPQAATGASQNSVWSAAYHPFGQPFSLQGSIAQSLRMPGQYSDAESGLYHNGFRDYGPGWGRYAQSDPIGLGGGVNTYGYAQDAPIKFSDPTGLVVNLNYGTGLKFLISNYLINYPGTFTIAGEGSNGTPFDSLGLGEGQYISAADLAWNIYYNDPNYLPGTPVVIIACNAGVGGSDSFAQQFATELNLLLANQGLSTTVYAPNGFISTDGMSIVPPAEWHNGWGKWWPHPGGTLLPFH